MKTIGVIGAGVIGMGVAQDFAQNGFPVTLIDITDQILDKAKEQIYNYVRFQALFDKGKTLENPERVIERINFTTDYQKLESVDFVVENVYEKWKTKKELYEKIDPICLPKCIFMVNTSCISITKIAALTGRPEKVIGAHFMNPVSMISTIELIKGYHTSKETVDSVSELLSQLQKECIIVNDFPGFVSNRISHLFINEAAFVVQDQVACPNEVDNIFKKCFGHKMGPLETADLIGLDTVVDSLNVLFESYQDSKFRCCPLLEKMVEAGLLGRKSGQGFYCYPS